MGRIICAWCGKVMGEFKGEGDTHTICEKCKKEEVEKLGNGKNLQV